MITPLQVLTLNGGLEEKQTRRQTANGASRRLESAILSRLSTKISSRILTKWEPIECDLISHRRTLKCKLTSIDCKLSLEQLKASAALSQGSNSSIISWTCSQGWVVSLTRGGKPIWAYPEDLWGITQRHWAKKKQAGEPISLIFRLHFKRDNEWWDKTDIPAEDFIPFSIEDAFPEYENDLDWNKDFREGLGFAYGIKVLKIDLINKPIKQLSKPKLPPPKKKPKQEIIQQEVKPKDADRVSVAAEIPLDGLDLAIDLHTIRLAIERTDLSELRFLFATTESQKKQVWDLLSDDEQCEMQEISDFFQSFTPRQNTNVWISF